MPKSGTVTFEIEPLAVLEGLSWLLSHNPYRKEKMGILVSALSPEEREEREASFLKRGNDAANILLSWLRRRQRLKTPIKKVPLCIERSLADWLASFDRSRLGIFGQSRSSSMTLPAEYFFLRCRVAVTRRMGRPRITPDQAARKLAEDTDAMSDRSFYRLMKREAERIKPDALGALMHQVDKRKTP